MEETCLRSQGLDLGCKRGVRRWVLWTPQRATTPRVDAKAGGDKGAGKKPGARGGFGARTASMGPANGTARTSVRGPRRTAACSRDAYGAGSARELSFRAPAWLHFVVWLFDRSKLETFELKFEISKYESCRSHTLLLLSQRANYVFLNPLPKK
jgi:hypothetical protein